MKNTTTILNDCQSRARILDQLAQTVETFKSTTDGSHFTYAIKASIMGEVVDAINNIRTGIEAQVMSLLGVSYTNTPYVAFYYIVPVPTRQFKSIKEIQIYYSNQIALMIQQMTLDAVDTKFIDDGVMGQGSNSSANPNDPKPVGNTPNNIYTKTGTWNTANTTIITDLGIINSSLMGEVPNIS